MSGRGKRRAIFCRDRLPLRHTRTQVCKEGCLVTTYVDEPNHRGNIHKFRSEIMAVQVVLVYGTNKKVFVNHMTRPGRHISL